MVFFFRGDPTPGGAILFVGPASKDAFWRAIQEAHLVAGLPDGCRIDVRLRSHDGTAELVIEDNGPGFPPDIASRALERFVKGKHSPGNGLGLAFADAVVQAHGGRVKVSNRPSGGATVKLSLPVGVTQPA